MHAGFCHFQLVDTKSAFSEQARLFDNDGCLSFIFYDMINTLVIVTTWIIGCKMLSLLQYLSFRSSQNRLYCQCTVKKTA